MKITDMYKPTERKRSFKVTAQGNDKFVITYMGIEYHAQGKKQLTKELHNAIATISEWAKGDI